MAKRVDPRVLRERHERELAAANPPVAQAPDPLAAIASERVHEPVLPEANSRADSLRSWGLGTMLLAILNGILSAVGGVLTLQNGGTEVAIGMFVAALSLIMAGFWFRDVHYAAADGLDALTETLRRLRKGRE